MASMTKVFHHDIYPAVTPTNPANNQSGKTVLVTGSSSGIGFSIAQSFLQAGAHRVIISGRNTETLNKAAENLRKEAKSTEVLTRIVQINDENSIKNLWAGLAQNHIVVDVLILNAAETAGGPMTPLLDYLPKLRTAIDTNVFANAAMTGYFLAPANSSNDPGAKQPRTLVNISSFMAYSSLAPMQSSYSISKAASARFFQHLAEEVPPEQCRIISVHPGVIHTDAVKNAPPDIVNHVVWDQGTLPGGFSVWASTPAANFLHGRLVWANWDVSELAERKDKFQDPGYLKLGLQGSEWISITDIFDKIREKEKGAQ